MAYRSNQPSRKRPHDEEAEEETKFDHTITNPASTSLSTSDLPAAAPESFQAFSGNVWDEIFEEVEEAHTKRVDRARNDPAAHARGVATFNEFQRANQQNILRAQPSASGRGSGYTPSTRCSQPGPYKQNQQFEYNPGINPYPQPNQAQQAYLQQRLSDQDNAYAQPVFNPQELNMPLQPPQQPTQYPTHQSTQQSTREQQEASSTKPQQNAAWQRLQSLRQLRGNDELSRILHDLPDAVEAANQVALRYEGWRDNEKDKELEDLESTRAQVSERGRGRSRGRAMGGIRSRGRGRGRGTS